jgi:hypothetical protein
LTVTNAHRLVKAALARKHLPVPRLRSDDTSGDVMLRRMPPRAPEPVTPRHVEAMPPKPAVRPTPVPVGPPVVVQRPSEPKEPPPQRQEDLDEVPVPVNAGRQLQRLLVRAVLGFFCVFALGSAVGGLVGAVAGAAESRAGDLRSLFAGAVLGGLVGAGFILTSRRKRRPLLPTYPSVPLIVLAGLCSICVVFVIVPVFSPLAPVTASPGANQTSSLALSVTVSMTALAWAVIFGRPLFRRYSRRHQATTGDQREVGGGQ